MATTPANDSRPAQKRRLVATAPPTEAQQHLFQPLSFWPHEKKFKVASSNAAEHEINFPSNLSGPIVKLDGRKNRAAVSMKAKKPTPKMSGLVVAALRNLRDAHGSTAKEIMKYIMAEYNASEATVQRQLKTALKRGVEFGILKKTNAGYSLNNDAEVIAPLDLAQVDGCGRRKRNPCKPKRRACPMKRKRASCPKKRRRKRKPCGVCAARGRKGDCGGGQPMTFVAREDSPDLNSTEGDREADASSTRSRSTSRSRKVDEEAARESRSNSQNRYSGSEADDTLDD